MLLLGLGWSEAGQAISLSVQRQAFQLAERALRQGEAVNVDHLQDYPLYPYLRYQQLVQRLERQPARAVRAFLRSYDDTLLADRLRAAWLKQLAEAKQWREFLRDYRASDDTAMDCRYRQALLATGKSQAALQGIEQVWTRGQSQPPECDPLFARWQAQGGFTRERVWRRFELALAQGQSGLARYLRGLLPAAERPTATLWLQVHANPRIVLEADRFDAANPRTALILLHGLERWSRQDSVSAAAALDRLKPRYRFPPAELAELERQLALFVASRGDPSALRRLNALPAAVVDTEVREWRVRTALQAPDWKAALTWLDRLEPAEANTAQWRYWRARALAASGRDQQAREIYRQLAKERDYHGFLAADHLHLPYAVQDMPLPIERAAQEALLAQLPGLQRARELYLLQRHVDARLEWAHATQNLNKAELRTAAKLAQSWDWHYQAIVTLARAQYWDDLSLRFPLPYRAQVLAQAKQQGLEPAWVYALMRQESLFRADARSSAGALGLMQIMPATGQRIAQALDSDLSGRYALLRADLNIRFGTYYLRRNLDRLQNNPLLATAAYNAGPNAVADWLPARGKRPADLWAETIPYKETRKYVKRIMEYAVVYEQRLGRSRKGSLQARMQAVVAGF